MTSIAYSCVGWHLHTLPLLSLSPRRTSRQNRIVSTFQRIWRREEEGGEGRIEDGGRRGERKERRVREREKREEGEERKGKERKGRKSKERE